MTHMGSETGCKTINDILHMYKVKSHKWTDDGLIAIRKNYEWLYFGWSFPLKQYVQTGSTIYYQRG